MTLSLKSITVFLNKKTLFTHLLLLLMACVCFHIMVIICSLLLGMTGNQQLCKLALSVSCLCVSAGIAIASALIDTSQQKPMDFKEKNPGLKNRKALPTAHQGTCVWGTCPLWLPSYLNYPFPKSCALFHCCGPSAASVSQRGPRWWGFAR